MNDAFEDLLTANRRFAETFTLSGFDGVAHAGVAVVTCMDSRIDPLRMLGLEPGDAKIFRNPGGRVTPQALEALVLGVHLLNVRRILVVPHTRCAMATSTLEEMRARVGASAGQDASWQTFGVVADQEAALRDDVRSVRSHPLIPAGTEVGGFLYDVDSGLLTPARLMPRPQHAGRSRRASGARVSASAVGRTMNSLRGATSEPISSSNTWCPRPRHRRR